MVTDLATVKRVLKDQLPALQRKYSVGKIGVFGSVVRGDNTTISDVDILVNLTEPVGLFKFIGLENHLADILGKKVDLTTPQALKPVIKNQILSEVVYV